MKNEKLTFRIIVALSIVVFIVVVMLNKKVITPPTEIPSIVYKLPALNAIINALCSILLVASFVMIKKKKIAIHKKINLTTFVLSALFLVSYITYHFYMKETSYGGDGLMKSLYYFILITHIVLAAVVLPMVLMSFYYGLYNKVEKHRKLVRFAFPIWLYVTITGVLVYLMISPYYPF
jgi:putative membrane protein